MFAAAWHLAHFTLPIAAGLTPQSGHNPWRRRRRRRRLNSQAAMLDHVGHQLETWRAQIVFSPNMIQVPSWLLLVTLFACRAAGIRVPFPLLDRRWQVAEQSSLISLTKGSPNHIWAAYLLPFRTIHCGPPSEVNPGAALPYGRWLSRQAG